MSEVELIKSEVQEDLVQATILVRVPRRVEQLPPPPFRDLLALPPAEAAMLDAATVQYRMNHLTITRLLLLQAVRMGLIGAMLQPLANQGPPAAKPMPSKPAVPEPEVEEAPAVAAEEPEEGWVEGSMGETVEDTPTRDPEPMTPEDRVVALYLDGIEFESIGRRVSLGIDEVKDILRKAGHLKKA
jgi:hypothetical protein